MALFISASNIHGVGLFTSETIFKDQEIIIAFEKKGNSYLETGFAIYVNHSSKPNTFFLQTDSYIKLLAVENIEINTEITANYLEIIFLLKEEIKLVEKIKFW